MNGIYNNVPEGDYPVQSVLNQSDLKLFKPRAYVPAKLVPPSMAMALAAEVDRLWFEASWPRIKDDQ